MSALSGYRLSRRVADKAFALAVQRSFAAWGAGTVLRLPVEVEGEGRIVLGRNVTIGAGSWLQTFAGGELVIGDGCSFSGAAVLSSATSIVIGDHVLMARNVHVLDHLHRADLVGVPILAQGVTAEAPVRIERGAWIGANVIILPGVTIGEGSVVGGNSVVRSDVPAHSVAVGAPAEVVRPVAA